MKFAMVRQTMNSIVPFAKAIGIDTSKVGDGTAEAVLDLAPDRMNHIGTMHAGAVFTLGEAASGGACAGAIAEQLMAGAKPVAASATIRYLKISKGNMRAEARTSRSGEEIRADLAENGKVRFEVLVGLFDETGEQTAEMQIDWSVKAAR